jgi:hypothetical protein
MDAERAKYLGRLEEKKQAEHSLSVEIDGLIDALRFEIDPTVDPAILNGERIANQGLQLSNKLIELEAVRQEMAKIRKILGR